MDKSNGTLRLRGTFAEKLLPKHSLKKHSLKKWIYSHGYTQPYLAHKLNVSTKVFKRKLRVHGKFDYEQIKRLILFMGAEDAFKVIYFPTKKRRKEVWWEAFGKYKSKEELNE